MFSKDPPTSTDNEDDEAGDHELRGLLSGAQTTDRPVPKTKRGVFGWLEDAEPWTRKRITVIAGVLIFLLLGAAITPPFMRSCVGNRKNTHPNSKFVGSELRSNGTNDFKRTVLIVSIDGLRCVRSLELSSMRSLNMLQGGLS